MNKLDALREITPVVADQILGLAGCDLLTIAPVLLCAEHDELTGNLFFQDNLLHFLLHRD
jgi:hypothetical protein